jgi:hypothetical protein
MMKGDSTRSLIAAIVATLGSAAVVLGASGAAVAAMQADAGGTLGIRIRLRIERSIPIKRIAGPVKDETEAIWRPYGVQFEWVDADAVEPRATGVSLDVTVERRYARVGGIEWASTLGQTFVGPDTRGWRPIRVSFDAVANVLADGTTSRVSGTGIVLEPYLSRALGRVLAHEIGHVLTNAAGHDRTGLMRASFSADQLAQTDRSPLRLACAAVDRLRHRFPVDRGAPFIAQLDTHVCIR